MPTSNGNESQELFEDFLQKVVEIEKQYAHEKRGAKTNRRSDILELVNRVYAKRTAANET